MADTIQINTDLRILSYVSPWWTECYAQHLQNITLTGSLSFAFSEGQENQHTQCLFSFHMFSPYYDSSFQRCLQGSFCWGAEVAPRKTQDQDVLEKSGPWGLGATQPVCEQNQKHTRSSAQGKPEQSPRGEPHSKKCCFLWTFCFSFPAFFSFHYAIKKRKAYRFGEMLWIVSSRWSEWWQWGIEHPRWLQRSNAWMVPHLCKEHVV